MLVSISESGCKHSQLLKNCDSHCFFCGILGASELYVVKIPSDGVYCCLFLPLAAFEVSISFQRICLKVSPFESSMLVKCIKSSMFYMSARGSGKAWRRQDK